MVDAVVEVRLVHEQAIALDADLRVQVAEQGVVPVVDEAVHPMADVVLQHGAHARPIGPDCGVPVLPQGLGQIRGGPGSGPQEGLDPARRDAI
jgi:hypothetical protein